MDAAFLTVQRAMDFSSKTNALLLSAAGDAALEEGLFLTKYASEVYVVHRRDQLRASQIMQARAFKNDKMKFIWNTVVEEIQGDGGKVTGALLKNVQTDEKQVFPIDGVFIFVGHIPNTDLFKDIIEMDDQDYVVVDKLQQTNIEGVFAAGDVHDHVFRPGKLLLLVRAPPPQSRRRNISLRWKTGPIRGSRC